MGGDNIYENDENNEIAKLLVEDKVSQECLAKEENKMANTNQDNTDHRPGKERGGRRR